MVCQPITMEIACTESTADTTRLHLQCAPCSCPGTEPHMVCSLLPPCAANRCSPLPRPPTDSRRFLTSFEDNPCLPCEFSRFRPGFSPRHTEAPIGRRERHLLLASPEMLAPRPSSADSDSQQEAHNPSRCKFHRRH